MNLLGKSSKANHRRLGTRDEKTDMEMEEDGVAGVDTGGVEGTEGEEELVDSGAEGEVVMVEDVGKDPTFLGANLYNLAWCLVHWVDAVGLSGGMTIIALHGRQSDPELCCESKF